MKKIILIIIFLLIMSFSLYSIENEEFTTTSLGLIINSYVLYSNNNEIALEIMPIRGIDEKSVYGNFIYDIIKRESIRRDIHGFPIATFFGRETHLLLGGNYVLFRFLDEVESGMVFLPSTCCSYFNKGYGPWPSGIEISCPSYLIEGTRSYTVYGLNKIFIGDLRDAGNFLNTTVLPWAEGEEGPGIGVTFSIKFIPHSPIADVWRKFGDIGFLEDVGVADGLVIMNGYVDFYRPDLFLKNNRVKRVYVKSTDDGEYFEFEYELKDVPEFQAIPLPRRTHSLEMTILDVYKGTIYDDTVITAILPKGRNNYSNIDSFEYLLNNSYYKRWDGK